MSQAKVTFVGICTHLREFELVPPEDAFDSHDTTPGSYSRTILVNGSLGARIEAESIRPHEAILCIPNEFIEDAPAEIPGLEPFDEYLDARTWKMRGVRLYFANASPGMSYKASYLNLPSLTERSSQPSLDLDPRVVRQGRAAAMFDLFSGELNAYRDEQAYDAVHVSVTVQFPGRVRELVIVRVWDQHVSRIRLKDHITGGIANPPNVFVMNVGSGDTGTDREIDFLLHYDVTTWNPNINAAPTPDDLSGIPGPNEEERRFLGYIPGGLSIGCSNSNYP